MISGDFTTINNGDPGVGFASIALPKITAISEDAAVSDQPLGFVLEQNYPNPFNPNTAISYAIPNDGLVTIKIYDALGREVGIIVNEYKSTGRYTAAFDASKLSSGIYMYRLTTKDFVQTKKMILVK